MHAAFEVLEGALFTVELRCVCVFVTCTRVCVCLRVRLSVSGEDIKVSRMHEREHVRARVCVYCLRLHLAPCVCVSNRTTRSRAARTKVSRSPARDSPTRGGQWTRRDTIPTPRAYIESSRGPKSPCECMVTIAPTVACTIFRLSCASLRFLVKPLARGAPWAHLVSASRSSP